MRAVLVPGPARSFAAPSLNRATRYVAARAITSNDFKTGMSIELDGQPWRVQEFLHVKPGKGSAFVRTKLKNYISGNTQERTFRAGEPIDLAVVEKKDVQYVYADGDDCAFMDMESYEEMRVKAEDTWKRFLKEGTVVQVVMYNGACISVEMPNSMDLEVTMTEPAVKGNTASGNATKSATLETGAEVQVPLFITTGEIIKVNTESGEYIGRVNK